MVKQRLRPRCTLIVLPLLLGGEAWAAGPNVKITGGVDAGGHNYNWTIEHDYSSALVEVEVPQFRADLFIPPSGWTGTIEAPKGWWGRNGSCIARVDNPVRGLPRKSPGKFGLRVHPRGTPRGQGEIRLKFADGAEVRVLAEVPVAESLGQRYTSLIGLGVIFFIFLLLRAVRGRSKVKPRVD